MTSIKSTPIDRVPARHLAALVAWVGFLVLVGAGANALGSVPSLAAPPLTDPSAWGGWAADRQPVEAAFAVIRLVVLVLACYLLVVTLAGVVARLGRARRLVPAIDVLTVPFVRRMVAGAVGVGLVGSTTAAGASAAGASTESDRRVVVEQVVVEQPPAWHDPAAGGPASDAPVDAAPPTMRRLGPAPVAAPVEVTLGAGDHLWSVAERALSGAWGRSPSDAEVAPYWEALVDANRARLADPANPDLVFPGQAVVLPTVPSPS